MKSRVPKENKENIFILKRILNNSFSKSNLSSMKISTVSNILLQTLVATKSIQTFLVIIQVF